ncbi:MAG: type II CRISPR RNA-guided endonuclease Cas9 [bacterium]
MRTLGLDLGTNSIGWALIETNGSKTTLLTKGVHLFEKGVGENQTGEYSLAAERTQFRAARRLKMRRKWRKQITLRVLIEHGYCPGIGWEDVRRWRDEKIFPPSPEFRQWLQTKEFTADGKPAGPYYYRWLAATQTLDLTQADNRYRLGRAFYHLAQRRGYQSNRVSGEEREGDVMGAIEKVDVQRGARTLGQYYYEDCLGKEAVRGGAHYTSRRQYEEEFTAICDRQRVPSELREALQKAIFTQRPLRSQKGTVGTCPLEPTKARAPISHPLFERYRALQTLSNIRLAAPGEADLRPLNESERAVALEWLLDLKKNESFDKLAKKLTPKKVRIAFGGLREGRDPHAWVFNYRDNMDVAPCPVTARLRDLFGSNWPEELTRRYVKAEGKTRDQVVDDVWHVLFTFRDHEKLDAFAKSQLALDEEQAKRFAKPVPQGYANLSLCAIRKIVPHLEKGVVYAHAVFMANLPTLLGKHGKAWADEAPTLEPAIGELLVNHRLDVRCALAVNTVLASLKEEQLDPSSMRATPATWTRLQTRMETSLVASVGENAWTAIAAAHREKRLADCVEEVCRLYRSESFVQVATIEERIADVLRTRYALNERELARLYHPSAIETYPRVQADEDGQWKLGSPRIPSIKNPVFMRTMTRLRHLINAMLKEGLIDPNTRIRIEMARDLNTQNERTAIDREHRQRAKENAEYSESIIKETPFLATETNVLKYRLWVEQNKRCLYTGNEIGLTEFLGENPAFDIEHTVPRSRALDNSQSNLTLCERQFNREHKGNKIPSELPEAEEILERARLLWGPKIEALDELAEKRSNAAKRAPTKETKDKARADFLFLRNQSRYWKRKLRKFEIEEIPEGFSNSQLVDTRIVCKYAMLYLKSLFEKVYSVKAEVVHGVKNIWELEPKYRGNHVHHCVDAIVTACLRPDFYQQLAAFYREVERYERSEGPRPQVPEPWDGFARDLNERLASEVLCVHYCKSNLLKPTFKRLRVRGMVQKKTDGTPILLKGNSARGALHKDTSYGIIQEPPTADNKAAPLRICVVRKKLDKTFKDFDNIVDQAVKRIVDANRERLHKGETVWFDEVRRVPINTVRVRVSNKPESLIPIGAHSDVSKHEYKQQRYAANDSNYIMALYRGTVNGKAKADWKVITNFEAVEATRKGTWETFLPSVDGKELQLRHVLKSGSLVLFCKDSPEELKTLSQDALSTRLYRLTVMEAGLAQFVHHACALPEKELGKGISSIAWTGAPAHKLRLSVNGINIAVAGQDFILDATGCVKWPERKDA